MFSVGSLWDVRGGHLGDFAVLVAVAVYRPSRVDIHLERRQILIRDGRGVGNDGIDALVAERRGPNALRLPPSGFACLPTGTSNSPSPFSR